MIGVHQIAPDPPGSQRQRRCGMNRGRWLCFALAIALITLAWFQIFSAHSGLVVRSLRRDSVPLLYLAPENAQGSAPGVLIAHGFAGSKQLMLGYGYVLAHQGYAVMLWDFDGHGSNSYPFSRQDLQQNLQTAWDALKQQPEWDAKRLASLGHSLGSFATLSAAVQHPASFAATVALSPVPAPVNARFPRNLQIQVGQWEPAQIQANGDRIMREAGADSLIPSVDRSGDRGGGGVTRLLGRGQYQLTQVAKARTALADLEAALAEGLARQQIEIPKVEHIGILFSDRSHQAALDWLDRTFGLEVSGAGASGAAMSNSPTSTEPAATGPGATESEDEGSNLDLASAPYRDRRLAWFGLHWLSGLVALGAIAPPWACPGPNRSTFPPGASWWALAWPP